MTQRSTSDILEDLAAYRAARTALVTGERVEDVWKDGRRMRLATLTLAEINGAIKDLQREYEAAEAVENGRTARRPIRLRYSN